VRRFVVFSSAFGLFAAALLALAQESKDTAKAAATRKKLEQKISVDYADESLSNVVEDLKEKVGGVGIRIDSKGGVSSNIKITYKGENKPLNEVLDGMFKKNGLGYYVISKNGDAYDGNLFIKQGSERGYEKGQEPDAAAPKAKAKDKPNSEETRAKDKPKEKPAAKEKPVDDADKAEQDAKRKLNFAKTFIDDGKTAKAKERLEEIVAKYPKTKAADEARALLKNLSK
jgi:FimV-like protein